MNAVETLVKDVMAAAGHAITPTVRTFIDSDLTDGDDIMALDDALQAVVLAHIGLPPRLLDRVQGEVLDAGMADAGESTRIEGWLRQIPRLQLV